MEYKFSLQIFIVSFSPYFLLFDHEPHLPTSIWQDVMLIINLDDPNVWL
jgi:hypothetical protein